MVGADEYNVVIAWTRRTKRSPKFPVADVLPWCDVKNFWRSSCQHADGPGTVTPACGAGMLLLDAMGPAVGPAGSSRGCGPGSPALALGECSSRPLPGRNEGRGDLHADGERARAP